MTTALKLVTGGKQEITDLVDAMVTDAKELRGFSGANEPPALAETRHIAERGKLLREQHKRDRVTLANLDDQIRAVIAARDEFEAGMNEMASVIEACANYQTVIEGIARQTNPAPKAPKRGRAKP